MVYEDEEPDIHDPNYDESYQVRPLGGLSFNTSDYLLAGLFYICKSFAFKCWHPAVRGLLFVFFSFQQSQCIGWHPLSLYVHVLILNC